MSQENLQHLYWSANKQVDEIRSSHSSKINGETPNKIIKDRKTFNPVESSFYQGQRLVKTQPCFTYVGYRIKWRFAHPISQPIPNMIFLIFFIFIVVFINPIKQTQLSNYFFNSIVLYKWQKFFSLIFLYP